MHIAWIGLGNMGLPMAMNLHSAGFPVTAFDVSTPAVSAAAKAGLSTAASASEAVDGADVVVTMLPAGAFVLEALRANDAIARAADHALFIDCSTTSVADAHTTRDLVAQHHRRFLDAPVSGGTVGAQAGTLTFMVGAEPTDFDQARPILEAMGSRIFHAGGVGSGQTAKIINNLLLAVNTQALCEAANIATGLGLDHRVLLDIAGASSGDSWALRNYYPVTGVVESAPSTRDFKNGFATRLMLKDLRLALAAAEQAGCSAPSGELVERQLTQLIERGLHDEDFSRLVDLVSGRPLLSAGTRG